MFLREVKRRNRNGSEVSYLQLAHNEWDSAAATSRTKILYSFGRADQVDTAAITRLIGSLSRVLDPASAFASTESPESAFVSSRPLGGTDVLDGLWRRYGIGATMSTLLGKRRMTSPVERVLFALVANRALAPSSKLLGSAAEVMAWYTIMGFDLGICVYNRLSRVLLGGWVGAGQRLAGLISMIFLGSGRSSCA
jgi:hypothetical protein